jgi:beta-lactamase superfamily II metal-dependent hydrolase
MKQAFINDVGKKFKVTLTGDDGKPKCCLLWGDRVTIEKQEDGKSRVRSGRWKEGGWVPTSALGDEGLLELYAIDVGQGDGILMRTPDDKWHLVDAGTTNERQMTKKGAANFVRWKFLEDLGTDRVQLEHVVVTHPDLDHFGGMINLLSGKLDRHDPFPVEVAHFWHSGMGRFASGAALGQHVAGQVAGIPDAAYAVPTSGDFITELLDGKASFAQPPRPFEKTYAPLARAVASVPKAVGRLSRKSGFLPGYDDQQPVVIRVLGPVAEDVIGEGPGLRVLGSDSVTRNGHSVVLRVEYGSASFLLTGDLNAASQRLLLSYNPAASFAVDVAKGCHHGSDDVDLRFTYAVGARATVISSGDNEDYAHPRPLILGACGRYGRDAKTIHGEQIPPLVYSTELARSLDLSAAKAVRQKGTTVAIKVGDAEIQADAPNAKYRDLSNTPISTNLVYGLINVRTDGRRILCGYLKERGTDFDIQVFQAGIAP